MRRSVVLASCVATTAAFSGHVPGVPVLRRTGALRAMSKTTADSASFFNETLTTVNAKSEIVSHPKSSKKWQPPVGYVPERLKTSPAVPLAAEATKPVAISKDSKPVTDKKAKVKVDFVEAAPAPPATSMPAAEIEANKEIKVIAVSGPAENVGKAKPVDMPTVKAEQHVLATKEEAKGKAKPAEAASAKPTPNLKAAKDAVDAVMPPLGYYMRIPTEVKEPVQKQKEQPTDMKKHMEVLLHKGSLGQIASLKGAPIASLAAHILLWRLPSVLYKAEMKSAKGGSEKRAWTKEVSESMRFVFTYTMGFVACVVEATLAAAAASPTTQTASVVSGAWKGTKPKLVQLVTKAVSKSLQAVRSLAQHKAQIQPVEYTMPAGVNLGPSVFEKVGAGVSEVLQQKAAIQAPAAEDPLDLKKPVEDVDLRNLANLRTEAPQQASSSGKKWSPPEGYVPARLSSS